MAMRLAGSAELRARAPLVIDGGVAPGVLSAAVGSGFWPMLLPPVRSPRSGGRMPVWQSAAGGQCSAEVASMTRPGWVNRAQHPLCARVSSHGLGGSATADVLATAGVARAAEAGAGASWARANPGAAPLQRVPCGNSCVSAPAMKGAICRRLDGIAALVKGMAYSRVVSSRVVLRTRVWDRWWPVECRRG